MGSSQKVSFSLKDKQKVQISVLAKRKVNITLVADDTIQDGMADVFDEKDIHIDNDLMYCDIKSFTEEMFSKESRKGDSVLNINIEEADDLNNVGNVFNSDVNFDKYISAGDIIKVARTGEIIQNLTRESDNEENIFKACGSVTDGDKQMMTHNKMKTSVFPNSNENTNCDVNCGESNTKMKEKGSYTCKRCKIDYACLKPFQKHMSTHESEEIVQNKLCDIEVEDKTYILETPNSLLKMSRKLRAKHLNSLQKAGIRVDDGSISVVDDSKTDSDIGQDANFENELENVSEEKYQNNSTQLGVEFESSLEQNNVTIHKNNVLLEKAGLSKEDSDEVVGDLVRTEDSGESATKSTSSNNNRETKGIIDSPESVETGVKGRKKNDRSYKTTEDRLYHCKLCEKKYKCSKSLKKHMNIHQGPEKIETGVTRKNKDRLCETTEDGLYHCKLCDKKYKCSRTLKQHMNKHEGIRPYQCKVCFKTFSWYGNLRGHITEVHTDKNLHQCPNCERSFSTRNLLNKHVVVHSEGNPLICDICKKQFLGPKALKKHLIVHSGIKSHKCSTCGMMFYFKHQLKDHMRVVHSGVCHYICDVCGKKFYREHHLRRHRDEVHCKEKHYSCKTCGRAFCSKERLVSHYNSHTKTKDVVCEVCGKTFSTQSQLKAHMVLHTGDKPFTCEFCGMKFRWAGGYSRHKRNIHLDVKKFECNVCEKRFYTKRECSDHTNSHTGNKPYQCKLCKTVFSHYSSMQQHYRNLHSTTKTNISTAISNLEVAPVESNLVVEPMTSNLEVEPVENVVIIENEVANLLVDGNNLDDVELSVYHLINS